MEENEKSYSKLEWLFYIVIFPIFFLLILAVLLLTFLGGDVKETATNIAKKIPVVSTLVVADEESQVGEESEQDLQEIEHVSGLSAEVAGLQTKVEEKEQEIETLKKQIEEFKLEFEKSEASHHEREEKLEELSKIYKDMSAKKAAAILENLSVYDAALLFSNMSRTKQSDILSKVDPETAAKITVLLKNRDKNELMEMAELQEQMDILKDTVEGASSSATLNQIVNTFAQMPAEKAANVLMEMSKVDQDFQVAVKVLANMDDSTRSSMLAEMNEEIARGYINSLAN